MHLLRKLNFVSEGFFDLGVLDEQRFTLRYYRLDVLRACFVLEKSFQEIKSYLAQAFRGHLCGNELLKLVMNLILTEFA